MPGSEGVWHRIKNKYRGKKCEDFKIISFSSPNQISSATYNKKFSFVK
jgi:hypothetical protein